MRSNIGQIARQQLVFAALASLLLVPSASAHAQSDSEELYPSASRADLVGYQRHSGGFFMRLSIGPGFALSMQDDSDTDTTITMSGGAATSNFAFGGYLRERLALHASLIGWSVVDPDLEFEQGGTSISGQTEDVSLSLFGLGVGITWYSRRNIYISPSLTVSQLALDIDGFETAESDAGVGVDFTVGKEWPVREKWGLGVAGGFSTHAVPSGDESAPFTGGSFGVRFTASRN